MIIRRLYWVLHYLMWWITGLGALSLIVGYPYSDSTCGWLIVGMLLIGGAFVLNIFAGSQREMAAYLHAELPDPPDPELKQFQKESLANEYFWAWGFLLGTLACNAGAAAILFLTY